MVAILAECLALLWGRSAVVNWVEYAVVWWALSLAEMTVFERVYEKGVMKDAQVVVVME